MGTAGQLENTMEVYKAINKVQSELAQIGISKNKKNQQQGYNFRGIDDVYAALSPLLAAHGLCVLPRMITRTCDLRATKTGGSMSYVTVEAEFDFVAVADGSKHTVKTFGEAMDSADKATNKAMSAAYKYAAFQSFAIPTEGDNDADSRTHNVNSAFNLEAAEAEVFAANTLQELGKVWAKHGAIASAAKDRDGYASLKALCADRKAALEAA
jgi:hypothetical protein